MRWCTALALNAQDRAIFFRCLSTLFQNGVTLVRSVDLLSKQCENRHLAAAAKDMADQLQRGQRLSQAMGKHLHCFSHLHIALIRVGESSGSIDRVFHRLAADEERSHELVQRLRSSLLLPLLITGLCVLLVAVVAPLVLGSVIQQMALDAGQMPWPTRLMMFVSATVRNPLCWVAAVLGAAGAWQALRRSDSLWRAQLLDRVPVLGKVLRLYAITRFTRTLDTSISVGFPLLKAMQMAGAASGHPLLEQRLPLALQAVTHGDELDAALERCEFFPRLFLQGVRAGQESGKLATMLGHLANIYQLEADYSTETFTRMLEPIVLGLVGTLVGFCVIATILPLGKLVDSL
jgi:type IV pilus assembly protein PilC